jgi:soluble lytic murein transglycosylase-like protein
VKRGYLIAIMAVVVAFVLVGGFFLARGALDALAANPHASPKPSRVQAAPTSAAPSPSPSEEPPPVKSFSPAPAKPTPTGPPIGPKPCKYEGSAASQSQVRTALENAAAYKVWTTSNVSLPASLVKAVAKHESGWQSNAVSCDGAYGLMQILASTQDWLNNRFQGTLGGTQDRKTLTGNTRLGSAYLQWLVKFLADNHFGGDYTLRACATSEDPCLLNAVISGYEVGGQMVLDRLKAGQGFANPDYVANVRFWMAAKL